MDGWMDEVVSNGMGMGLSTMGSRGKGGGKDVVDVAPANLQEKVARRKAPGDGEKVTTEK